MILLNIEPTSSPENKLKLDKLRADEKSFAIFDQSSDEKLMILHDNGCWTRSEHSCEYLPPESALQQIESASIGPSNTLHLDIGMIVLGDLSMPGCYVDWAAVKIMLAEQRTT